MLEDGEDGRCFSLFVRVFVFPCVRGSRRGSRQRSGKGAVIYPRNMPIYGSVGQSVWYCEVVSIAALVIAPEMYWSVRVYLKNIRTIIYEVGHGC